MQYKEDINAYYRSSKLGYQLFLGGSQHFGFYPSKKNNISESEAQYYYHALVVKKLKLTECDICLDAGCGQGVVSCFLSDTIGCTVYGISIVPHEVGLSMKRAENSGISSKTYYSIMDYNEILYQDNYFDCVYTTETLSHSIDLQHTLGEMYRVLKNGGRVAFFEYGLLVKEQYSDYENIIIDRIIQGSAMFGLREFYDHHFYELLHEAGFTNICEEDISLHISPSLERFYKLAYIAYYVFVKPFGLQKYFPNVSSAVEFYVLGKKGKVFYKVYTATK